MGRKVRDPSSVRQRTFTESSDSVKSAHPMGQIADRFYAARKSILRLPCDPRLGDNACIFTPIHIVLPVAQRSVERARLCRLAHQ